MPEQVPALVSTEWLASRLGTPGLVIADATYHLPNTGREAAAEYLVANPETEKKLIEAIKTKIRG